MLALGLILLVVLTVSCVTNHWVRYEGEGVHAGLWMFCSVIETREGSVGDCIWYEDRKDSK